MSQPKLVVVYRCTHELPDTDMNVERAKATPYQFPPSMLTRLKKKISIGTTIRRPCMDLCPVCQARERVLSKQTSMVQVGRSVRSQTFSPQASQSMIQTPAHDSPAATDSQPQTPRAPQPWNLSEGPPFLPDVEALAAGWDAKIRRDEKHTRGLSRKNTIVLSGLSPTPPRAPPPQKDSSAHIRVNRWAKEQTDEAVEEQNDGLASFNRFSDISEERESPVDPRLKGLSDRI
ncbi:hypothetical protein EAF04_008810 [Stromatinia cepivora]|nr:hypothetical protein EAF04_008810 [Stromatinia cepivora]